MNVIQAEVIKTVEEPNVLSVIIIGLILIIGFSIFLMGLRRKKPMLWYSGIGLSLGAIVTLFTESESFRDLLISAAVIFATVISAFSLNEGIKQRKETIEREEKDRLEQSLKELSGWATKVLKNMMIAARFVASQSDLKERIMDCRAELAISAAESIKILAICNGLVLKTQISASDADTLQTSLKTVDESLRNFVTMLFDFDLDNPDMDALNTVISAAYDLTRTLRRLLEISSDIASK